MTPVALCQQQGCLECVKKPTISFILPAPFPGKPTIGQTKQMLEALPKMSAKATHVSS